MTLALSPLDPACFRDQDVRGRNFTSDAAAPANGDTLRSDTKRIHDNLQEFQSYVDQARRYLTIGQLDMAAFSIAGAAQIATHRHCGIFASPACEAILNEISALIPDGAPTRRPGAAAAPAGRQRVLHIASELAPVGGLTRMISRWTNADRKRQYSLALTQHRGAIPAHLRQAIAQSGGEFHRLDIAPGHWIRRAQNLRALARHFDAVILHIHCEDVLAHLAFGGQHRSSLPPILFLNHADHLFWLGGTVSDLTIHLRPAASDLGVKRRFLAPERCALLPTIIDPAPRQLPREEAKRRLGLKPDEPLLVSIARGAKYRTLNRLDAQGRPEPSRSFADRHVDILRLHPTAQLFVIGPAQADDWQDAIRATSGRIRAIGETPEPGHYFDAADLYVDSFPFVSSTSMMEAAQRGLPLTSFFDGPADSSIRAINHIGLERSVFVANNEADYTARLNHLLCDADFARAEGERAEQNVSRANFGPAWVTALDDIMLKAQSPPRKTWQPDPVAVAGDDHPQLSELDLSHPDYFGTPIGRDDIAKLYLGDLPFRDRWLLWRGLVSRRQFASAWHAAQALLPEWLKRRLRDHYGAGLRKSFRMRNHRKLEPAQNSRSPTRSVSPG